MGPSPILSIIHTVTIGTILNFNGGIYGHGVCWMLDLLNFASIHVRLD